MKRYLLEIESLVTAQKWGNQSDDNAELQAWLLKQQTKGPRHLGYPDRWTEKENAREIDLVRMTNEEEREEIVNDETIMVPCIFVPAEYSYSVTDRAVIISEKEAAKAARLDKIKDKKVNDKDRLQALIEHFGLD